ncbi:MAG: hypothetical protein Q8M07_28895 [Prosthecobacter sp.]|nr:hypothetical protein [Prosthecobacter sp.]
MENAKFLNSLEAGLEERKRNDSLSSLRLIITCRAAEWPEGKLAHLWPQAQFTVARLCQLDWKSANDFVSKHLGDQTQAFWDEVNALKIHFLAIWPHSLAGLVESFRANNGRLPSTLFELVQQTARRRCDVNHGETDQERRERLHERDVPLARSYRLASSAAALSCFSGRSMLSVHPGDAGTDFITADEFLSGVEPMLDGSILQPESKDLTDLKRLAVFDSVAGGHRLVFSHQLMREFLAAAWLADRGVPVTQLEQLFGCRREDGAWRHYPQLTAVAAWLASHPEQKAWRNFLIKNDPAVLLRADAAGLSECEKKEITAALLECAVRDRAVDAGWQHHQLRGLASDGLAEILRPYLLNDSAEHEAARGLAVDIVREAKVRAAAETLWEAVRPPHAKQRPAMAYALMETSHDSHEREWTEILEGDIPVDDEGALLGAALKVMVPSRLKVRDVLHHLIPEQDFGIIGLYTRVHDLMVDRMEKADALPVVRHSATHHASGFSESWKKNQESILSKALKWLAEDMDQPEVMSAFVEWWHAASVGHKHKPSWNDKHLGLQSLGFDSADRRHLMIEVAVDHPKLAYMSAKDYFWLSLRTFFVRHREDIIWLADKLNGENSRSQQIWAVLLSSAFYQIAQTDDAALKHKLQAAFEKSGAVRSLLPTPAEGRTVFEEIAAHSAEQNRQMAEEELEMKKQQCEWDEERREQLEFLFQEARRLYDTNNWKAWEWLSDALFHEQSPNGGVLALSHVEKIHEHNQTWMYDAARRWLAHEAPDYPQEENSNAGRVGITATWALYALWNRLEGDVEVLAGLPGWLPHIFDNMLRSSWDSGDFTIENCLRKFSPGGLDAILAVFRADYMTNSSMWSLQHLTPIASEAVPGIKQMLLDSPPQPTGFRNALAWLAAHDLESAEKVASHWLDQMSDKSWEASDIALLGAIILHLNGQLWNRIKSQLLNQPEVASRVLLTAFSDIGFHLPEQMDVSKWPTDYLAEVVVLMTTTFQPDQDPKSRAGGRVSLGFSGVTPRQEVTRARNTLLTTLAERGVPDAIRRLESLGLQGTEFWFRHLHLRASTVNQASRWHPVPPKDLLALAAGHDLGLVKDNEGLMRAVLIYLKEYERDLHTTSHWRALQADEEESMSDHLALWLEEKHGIQRIRENQTHAGKREDVTVAFNRAGEPPLTVCIEVKKHDSAALLEKMETQLLELYLKAQRGRTHGIFVVFWFEDGELAVHPGISTKEQLSEYLNQQAARLSAVPYRLAAKVIDCRALPVPKKRKPAASSKRKKAAKT